MATSDNAAASDLIAAIQTLTPIDKYMYLRKVYDTDRSEYYRALMARPDAFLPYIYTPTVGEACEKYHQLGIKTHGLYLHLNSDRGRILEKLKAWPNQNVRVIVVTDGERILGLGDLGSGGMGISEGKITLYTVAAGVDPELCLPVCLDVGTNTQRLLDDPTYPGLRARRPHGPEYDNFIAEFISALQHWQPHTLLQFEDFGNENAFRVLEKYRTVISCFNDDIQGTAAITLAALLAAIRVQDAALRDQRILFMGAGEAGTGIGELIAYCIHRNTGISRQDARKRCFFMDSKGLVCANRSAELAAHKLPFAHDLPHVATLIEAVHAIKPTALIGVSTIPNSFTEEVVRAMAVLNPHPIIFPLSNPTSKSECTFEQAWRWTDGRVLFASGSPFDPLTVDASGAIVTTTPAPAGTHVVSPSQSNNAYVFPSIGMAALLTRASHLTDETFLVAAQALAELADPHRVASVGELFPPFDQILDVSAHIAARVAEHLVSAGAGTRPFGCTPGRSSDATHEVWRAYIAASQWRSPSMPLARQACAVQLEPHKPKELHVDVLAGLNLPSDAPGWVQPAPGAHPGSKM